VVVPRHGDPTLSGVRRPVPWEARYVQYATVGQCIKSTDSVQFIFVIDCSRFRDQNEWSAILNSR